MNIIVFTVKTHNCLLLYTQNSSSACDYLGSIKFAIHYEVTVTTVNLIIISPKDSDITIDFLLYKDESESIVSIQI